MMRAGLMCLEQFGDAVHAESYFRTVLASDQENYEALDAYAELCSAQERFEEAADFFDAAISGAPDSEKVDLQKSSTVFENELDFICNSDHDKLQ